MSGDIFQDMIRPRDPEKGITAREYADALDMHVKTPIKTAFFQLCEAISGLPEIERDEADNYLAIQRAALMLWEQLDKKVFTSGEVIE